MMIRNFLLFTLLFISNGLIAQHIVYDDGLVMYDYYTNDGRLEGEFTAYHINGEKKAQGEFENNYRIGKWTLWDSSGTVQVIREYSDPFVYKSVFPRTQKNKLINLLDVQRYSPEYNEQGFYDYFHVQERMVTWSARYWRYISPKNNSMLFVNNLLFNLFHENVMNGNAIAYDPIEEFKKELSPSEIDTTHQRIVGFKIKEDAFFDNDRLLFEIRIISICPVVENIKTKEISDLYWIYYPQLREYLAQVQIKDKGLTSKIKTLDDVFFYRRFSSSIYSKYYNYYGNDTKEYKGDVNDKVLTGKLEIEMIEMEHKLWLKFNGYK